MTEKYRLKTTSHIHSDSHSLSAAIHRPNVYAVWIHGTFSSESRVIHDLAPGAYPKLTNNRCWDSYKLESVVIVDGIDHTTFLYHFGKLGSTNGHARLRPYLVSSL